jgi:hypothetical protein
MEDGDQETLVHALSMSLRRSREAANTDDDTNTKISIASSPFTPFSPQQYHNDMRDSSRFSNPPHRHTNMMNILDAALSISDEVNVENILRQPHILNSQISLGSMSSTTESDETEERQ